MLRVDHLSVEGGLQTLTDLSFKAESGSCLGIVGPNDSGKSLLLETLAGVHPYSGAIKINHFNLAHEPDKAKAVLGFLPQHPITELHLTGYEFLELIGSYYSLSGAIRSARILELATQLNCRPYLFTTLEHIGQAGQQRISFMAAILHQPKVLLLDEPTLYLDWHGQHALLQQIKHCLNSKTTVVVASNDLAFLDLVADEFIFLDRGELKASGQRTQLAHLWRSSSRSLPALYRQAYPMPEVSEER